MKTKILFLLLSIAITGTNQATQVFNPIIHPTLQELSVEKIDQLLQSLYPNDYHDQTRYQKIIEDFPISFVQKKIIINYSNRFPREAAKLWASSPTDRTPLELLEYRHPKITKQVSEKKIKWHFSFENLINEGGAQILQDRNDSLFHLSLTSFKGLEKIPNILERTSLDLSNNLITEIHAHTFNGLPHLEELYLHKNPIKIIHENAFYGLASLKSLHFDDNAITSIHKNAFNGLSEKLKMKFQ